MTHARSSLQCLWIVYTIYCWCGAPVPLPFQTQVPDLVLHAYHHWRATMNMQRRSHSCNNFHPMWCNVVHNTHAKPHFCLLMNDVHVIRASTHHSIMMLLSLSHLTLALVLLLFCFVLFHVWFECLVLSWWFLWFGCFLFCLFHVILIHACVCLSGGWRCARPTAERRRMCPLLCMRSASATSLWWCLFFVLLLFCFAIVWLFL